MLEELFQLKNQSVVIINVNPRMEIHGTEHRMAADIKVSMKVENTFLDRFDKGLRPAFFWKAPPEADDQEDLVNNLNPDHLPNLRFKAMDPKFAWDYRGAGYKFKVPSLLGMDDLVLIQCDLDQMTFEVVEGGSVIVGFRVVAHPNNEDMGELCGLIQQEVELTLEPPSPEDQLRHELNDAA